MTDPNTNIDNESSEAAAPPISAGSGNRWSVALRALHHRNFQLFFGGQLISLVGTWMQTVAQAWLVYRITGSSLLLGSVGFAKSDSGLSSRPSRRRHCRPIQSPQIVIATQIASMLLAFILAS